MNDSATRSMEARRRGVALAVLLLLSGLPAMAAEQAGQELVQTDSFLEPAAPELLAALKRNVPEVRFEAVALSDALEHLRQLSGLNFVVNWREIEAAGVERGEPVTLRLKSVPLGEVLKATLEEVGGGRVKLAFGSRSSIVYVSTADGINKDVAIKVYEIGDIIAQRDAIPGNPIAFLQRELTLLRVERDMLVRALPIDVLRLAAINQQIDHDTGRLVAALQQPSLQAQDQAARTREVETLMKLIQESIDRTAWVDNGGSVASMQYFNNKLIITATLAIHHDIEALLTLLRAKPPKLQN